MSCETVVDVVVVGAGIVGAAIARDLAGTGLRVTLVEGRDDVGDGTSKANTALLHTGFDATPGTLESRLVARGSGMAAAAVGRGQVRDRCLGTHVADRAVRGCRGRPD